MFSHGDPRFESWIVKWWERILNLFRFVRRTCKFILWFWRAFWKVLIVVPITWVLIPLTYALDWSCAKFFDYVGDLRDDINDSWGADRNAKETDILLNYFYALQNPKDGARALNVVILSGDIHTAGYSTIYSNATSDNAPNLGKPIIHHIVASPVGYTPFPWMAEAYFRNVTQEVILGDTNRYRAQISHHFCRRNVAVVSLRTFGTESLTQLPQHVVHFC